MARLFIDKPLVGAVELALTDAQAHYLCTVLRLPAGAEVTVFNGADGEYRARLAHAGRRRTTLHVVEQSRAQQEEPDLWLAYALLKRDATDLVVQKATELGVSALLPVVTARTNAGRTNIERLSAIAREAAEQCERMTVPRIMPVVDLSALLAAWPSDRRLAVAMERHGPAPIPRGAGALFTGPEGGFTDGELDALRRSRFVSPLTLGPRILRAETAAITGLALLQAEGG